MSRRGRCRCGFVLKFHRGENGYKTRCPECGAMVRLRRRGKTKVRLHLVPCTCGYKVMLPFDGASAVCPACARVVTAPEPAGQSPAGIPPAPLESKRAGKRSTLKKSRRQRALANASAAAVESAPPPAKPRSRVAIPCAVCLSLVPPETSRCPGCGATVTHEAPAPLSSSGPRPAAPAEGSQSGLKMILGWLGALTALLLVAGIILAMMLSH